MKLIGLIFFAILSLGHCQQIPYCYQGCFHNAPESGIPDSYARPQNTYNRPDVQIDGTNYLQQVPASGIPDTYAGPHYKPPVPYNSPPYALGGYNNPSPNIFYWPTPNWP
ncbi:uncharacterized protein LOC120772902 [Bactrocera tryoni]|uniref:uncharacterized protein LOC120772902 n=1 Tax=Bactrocera tryoni TaxID=59916 RepID=UPI001A978E66|nr:uncharacterized protein LOC120772902 [Bactrocera tryoni]